MKSKALFFIFFKGKVILAQQCDVNPRIFLKFLKIIVYCDFCSLVKVKISSDYWGNEYKIWASKTLHSNVTEGSQLILLLPKPVSRD